MQLHIQPDSDALYVFFTGMGRDEPVPQFEFVESAEQMDGSTVLVRDPHRLWYHAPIAGFGDDVPAMAATLQQIIDRASPERVRLVGNSMGGFAAILFASLLDRGEAVAFVPQTFLAPHLRLRYGHWRDSRLMARFYGRCWRGPRFWDLRAALRRAGREVSVDLYTSAEDLRDRNHARHVERVPGVRVHRIANSEYGHNVVRKLKEDGRLLPILRGDADGKGVRYEVG